MARAIGLDLGRVTGWALAGPQYLAGWKPRTALEGPRVSNAGLSCGQWKLGPGDHDSLYAELWERVEATHRDAPLTAIFYEASGGKFLSQDAVWIQIGLAAVVRCWARLSGVTAELVNNRTVKKHATQFGSADKPTMIDAAERLGWEPPGEHAADALFVLDAKLSEWHRRR